MTLDILICTMGERLGNVAKVLLRPLPNVSYVVSCQYDSILPIIPDGLVRDDVRVTFLQGRGLSRNRNHALFCSSADIVLIADDDETLVEKSVLQLIDVFKKNPSWHLVQMRTEGTAKTYPASYVSSCELAMRRESILDIRFDERFGLGSSCLASGEEEIFVHECKMFGITLWKLPIVICKINGVTTGSRFPYDKKVQRSKGAVFCLMYGKRRAYMKCMREALSWALHRCVNPFVLYKNMLWGIRYVS